MDTPKIRYQVQYLLTSTTALNSSHRALEDGLSSSRLHRARQAIEKETKQTRPRLFIIIDQSVSFDTACVVAHVVHVPFLCAVQPHAPRRPRSRTVVTALDGHLTIRGGKGVSLYHPRKGQGA